MGSTRVCVRALRRPLQSELPLASHPSSISCSLPYLTGSRILAVKQNKIKTTTVHTADGEVLEQQDKNTTKEMRESEREIHLNNEKRRENEKEKRKETKKKGRKEGRKEQMRRDERAS